MKKGIKIIAMTIAVIAFPAMMTDSLLVDITAAVIFVASLRAYEALDRK